VSLPEVHPEIQKSLDALSKKSLPEQLDYLVKLFAIPAGALPPTWSRDLASNYLQRLAIEQTAKLTKETSRLTRWLICLTWALVIVTSAGIFAAWWFWAHPNP